MTYIYCFRQILAYKFDQGFVKLYHGMFSVVGNVRKGIQPFFKKKNVRKGILKVKRNRQTTDNDLTLTQLYKPNQVANSSLYYS